MARLTRFLPALVSVAALALRAGAADTGTLYVKSNPSGATVVIAGKEHGKTPVLVRDHPAGDFTLELRLPGAEPVRKQVTVKANTLVTIDVNIPLPSATLTVISEPLEATVLLDGREVGKTPLTLKDLDPGEHRLTLLKEGYPRTPRSLVLEPGGKRVLKVKLDSGLRRAEGASAPQAGPAAPERPRALPSVPQGAIAIVIKTDGTRLEGKVTGLGDTVVVRTKSGSERVPRGEVRAILNTAVCLDRFKADPNAKDLMVLASRASVPMPLRKAELLVTLLKNKASIKQVEMRGKYPDVLAAAEELLDMLRLTPEHTREVIDANRAAFKKHFGRRATEHESKHYWILTTAGKAYARKVAVRMDAIFREYQRRLVFKERLTEKFVVKVYASESEYKAHGAPPDSMAYFSPGKRELVGYYQHPEDHLFRSLYHEGMHQFLHFYVPNAPTWFGEGLAKYFESGQFFRGARGSGALRYRVGRKDPLLATTAKRAAMLGALVPLKRLIRMSRDEFYTNGPDLNYSQAWALTHFMIEGGNPLLKKCWKGYFFALRDGATQEEANEKVFGRANFRMLDDLFEKYVMKF